MWLGTGGAGFEDVVRIVRRGKKGVLDDNVAHPDVNSGGGVHMGQIRVLTDLIGSPAWL